MEKTETNVDLRRRLGDSRQYGTALGEIKENHKKRYVWAMRQLKGKRVVDAGCGIGYGSWLLGETCQSVLGIEFNAEIVKLARQHWVRPNVTFRQGDIQTGAGDELAEVLGGRVVADAEAVVAFEIIEHLVVPELFFSQIDVGSILLGSSPNRDHTKEDIVRNPFHIRHYTHDELQHSLVSCGFEIISWSHQDLIGEIEYGQKKAQTIVFEAERRSAGCPPNLQEEYQRELLRELSRRSNAINDLKNGAKIRPATAY